MKAGGRLLVNGVTVVDLPTDTGQFQEGIGTFDATSSPLSIQILTFDNGNAEVQLSYALPNETELEVVPTNELTPPAAFYRTTSQADGTFTIPNVPTTLGAIVVTALKTVDGRTARAHSAAIAPVPGGASDVGTLRLNDFATLYGASFNGPAGPSTLYTVDPATGAGTPVGPIGFWRVGAMDVSADGVIYAIGRNTSTGRSVLLTINPATGAGTQIGETGVEQLGFGDTISDIAFRPSDGALFAYLEAGDGLGTIDIATGAVHPLGRTLVSCCGNGMAFAPDGRLLHANESGLHVLDQTTGAATTILPIAYPPLNFPRFSSMKFQADTSDLFGFIKTNGGNGTYLARMDITTGVVTLIGRGRSMDSTQYVGAGTMRQALAAACACGREVGTRQSTGSMRSRGSPDDEAGSRGGVRVRHAGRDVVDACGAERRRGRDRRRTCGAAPPFATARSSRSHTRRSSDTAGSFSPRTGRKTKARGGRGPQAPAASSATARTGSRARARSIACRDRMRTRAPAATTVPTAASAAPATSSRTRSRGRSDSISLPSIAATRGGPAAASTRRRATSRSRRSATRG